MINNQELQKSVEELLVFIQQKYPGSWKNGEYQWYCPYHKKIAEVTNFKGTPPTTEYKPYPGYAGREEFGGSDDYPGNF